MDYIDRVLGVHIEGVYNTVHTEVGESPVALGRSYLLTSTGTCLGSRPSIKSEYESLFNQLRTRTRQAASNSLCWHRVGFRCMSRA